MSTWTFRARAPLALLTCWLVSGCLELPQTAGAEPVRQVSMARGDVRLTTPEGYCIDPRASRDRFALIGRCDTLGVEGFFNPWDLAIVAVSTTPVAPDTANPAPAALSGAPDAGTLLSTVERGGLALVQLQKPAPDIEGVADVYWRTAFVINGQLVSATLYAPPGSPALGREGARILERVVRATRASTPEVDA